MQLRKIILFFALLFSITGWAQQQFVAVKNPKEVLAKIQANSATITSISADYEEVKEMLAFSKPQVSKGKFYFQAPDKMRFEQATPFSYIILVNGEQLRISDNGKEKKVPKSGNVALKANSFLLSLVQGEFNEDLVQVSCFKTNENISNVKEYAIELLPKQKMLRQVYEKVILIYGQNDLHLSKIIFKEVSGDYKTMNFSKQEYNSIIAESIFKKL